MCSGGDWKNPQLQATNSPSKQKAREGGHSKERKFENLSSNIFNDEGVDSRPLYTEGMEKVAYGSTAEWTTQAGTDKIINRGSTKVDTYQKRQNQLSSQVLDATDYQGHAPMTKKKFTDKADEAERRNNHNYSNALGTGPTSPKKGPASPGRKPHPDLVGDLKSELKKDFTGYDHKVQKRNQLSSALDTHSFTSPSKQSGPAPKMQTPDKTGEMVKKQSRAAKVRDLSSDLLGTGETTAKYLDKSHKNEVYDLDLKGLPANADKISVKTALGIKHVIEVTVNHDNLTNDCNGTGRVKLRLNPGENIEQVKLNLLKEGLGVQEHKENPNKKPAFTTAQTLRTKSPTKEVRAIDAKIANLSSGGGPDLFGSALGGQQASYAAKEHDGELNSARKAAEAESLTMSNWKATRK